MPVAALVAAVSGIAASLAVASGRFALGGCLFALSALSLRWPQSVWDDTDGAELPPTARRWSLLAVCATAAFFRAYRLNQPGLWGDDALNGLLAYDILDGRITSPFEIVVHSHSHFHALSNYFIAAAFWLLGPDLTTLRLPGIVLGGLCVPLLYATAAPLFGSTVALLAALFCATSPTQLTHSKELIQIIAGQFFQLAGLCLLVRGIAARRGWMVAAAGMPLAMCLYTYHSARVAPLVAIVYGVAVLLSRRRRAVGERGTPSGLAPGVTTGWLIATFAAASLVFALSLVPAAVGYADDPYAMVQRVNETWVFPQVIDKRSLRPLWESVSLTLLAFHYKQGPEYHWFGLAFDPALNAVVGFLLIHGLVQSLLRWRQPRHLLLLAWCAVGLLPAALSTGAPRIYRALLALPPMYVWAALPLWRLLAVPALGRARVALRGLALALLVVVPLIDFNYYFYRLYTHPTFRYFQGARIVDMARTLREHGPGWTGYLLSDTFSARHEIFRFLSRAWGLRIQPVASLSDVLPLRDRPENGALFMMTHGAQGAAAAFATMYPDGRLVAHRAPEPRSWWLDRWWPIDQPPPEPDVSGVFYEVPRAELRKPILQPPIGLQASYEVDGRRVQRREPYPFYFFLEPTFAHPFSATWRGRITVPDPGPHRLTVNANGITTVWIDGRKVGSNVALEPGVHELVMEMHDTPIESRLKLYWQRPHSPRQLVPPSAFSPP